MMNIIAIGMLLASLGLIVVLSPEPTLVMSSLDDENVLEATKRVAQETLLNVEEKLGTTKETLVKGVEVVTKPTEKSMGWFQRKPKPEDHFNGAKDKIILAKESIQEASIGLKDGALEKLSSTINIAKEKAGNIYDETGKYVDETKSQTKEATKNVIGKTKELTKDGINNVYDKAKFIKDVTHDVPTTGREKEKSTIQRADLRAKEIIDDAYTSVIQTFGSVKDKTDKTAGETQDTLYDAVGYMKEKLQDIVVGAKDEVYDISVTTKETTCNDVDFAKRKIYDNIGRSRNAISDNVQLGADKIKEVVANPFEKAKVIEKDATYDMKEVINGGDHMETSKEITANMNENVDEMDKNFNAERKNGANSAINPARNFYDNMKDKYDHCYHEKENHIRNTYDSARDIVQDDNPNVEQHYRDIRDYYDKSNDNYKNKDTRQYQKSIRDVPSSTKGVVENYYNDIKDKTRDVFEADKDTKRNYYDDTRSGINGPIPNQCEEGSTGYYSMAREKIAHGFSNAHDIVEDYYDNTKFKPGKDLSDVVESMGWRRIGIVPPNHVLSSTFEEVMIGNVKYAWHGKDQPSNQESLPNHMPNRIKDALHNKLSQRGRSWLDCQSKNLDLEDGINSKDDDYNYKRSQKLKERMQNPRNAYESQQSKEGQHLYLTQEEFYENDEETMEVGRDLHSWKDVIFQKPKGFLLTLIRALHLFTFSIVYGSSFWMIFVSGIILSKHIPRQQFGYVQSQMFPVYLRILAIGESNLFILQFFMHPWFSANSIERCQLSNFGLMIASTLINAYVLEPQATKIMFERLKVEKEERRGLEIALPPMEIKQLMEEYKKKLVGINQQIKALHGYSSALNLLSLGGLTCHLWHLAHHLVI